MKKTLFGVMLVIAGLTACRSANADWAKVAENETFIYALETTSIRADVNNSNEPIIAGIGAIGRKADNALINRIWYVTKKDCKADRGELAVLDMDGKFITSSTYELGTQTIGATIAGVLCSAPVQPNKKKSV